MRVIATLALATLSCLPLYAAATTPTDTQIKSWISSDIKEMIPTVEKIVPITLKGGEQAYLASVSYENSSRNGWAGYLLVRPKLQQARELENFGGQYNGIELIDQTSVKTTVAVIGTAYSGQGIYGKTHYVVSFNDWSVNTLYEAQEENNSGNCGEITKRYCEGNNVFINFLMGASDNKHIAIAITNVSYSSPDTEKMPYKYEQDAKIVFIENNKI